MRRLMLENGMEVAPLGNSKIEVGQFTIKSMNSRESHIHTCKSKITKDVKYVCVWLDNADVIIPQKYSNIPVMTESTIYSKVGNSYSSIVNVSNGTTYVNIKSQFGVKFIAKSDGILAGNIYITMQGHSIFNVVPETYNYMIVYE